MYIYVTTYDCYADSNALYTWCIHVLNNSY